MQELPLSVTRILNYGSTVFGDTTITSWTDSGPEHTTFAAVGARAAALAHALGDPLGVTGDARVGTLMDNCAEHLEIFFAASCSGAIFNPLNSHLSDDQLIHIINATEQHLIFVSPRNSLRLVESIAPSCPTLTTIILTSGSAFDINLAATDINSALTRNPLPRPLTILRYEELLDGRSTDYPWPTLPETDAAAMCFSTGTEGAPKGVAYSHRSMYLHAQSLRAVDSFAITNGSAFLCCVPIYHVLSWGVPLAAFMAGTPLIFPGHDVSAARLAHIIETSMPRSAHGVPTLWVSLMAYYLEHPPTRMSLQEIFAGGAPVPPMLIKLWEEHFGVDVIHCWGMTETSPVGTVSRPPAGISGQTRQAYRASQGRFPVGMEYRIVDEKGRILEGHDRNQGEIQVRGNWVTGSYFTSPQLDDGGLAATFRGHTSQAGADKFTPDGWLRTGDVGSVNRDGFLTVMDRMKDVIRSGGEWIYSAELENLVVDSPVVLECAVIGYPDETWGERPLAVTVLADGIPRDKETAERIRDRMRSHIPGWMLPEYWAFVDQIDKTSVDKYDKKDLRKHLAAHELEVIALKGPRRTPKAPVEPFEGPEEDD